MDRLIIMGVAGCGKSSVGAELATKLGATYFDGDDLHPAANITKMQAGTPLNDDDRWPWLRLVGARLNTGHGIQIVGCSALKRAYRDLIRDVADGPICFVHLSGSKALIGARMQARSGHFMPTSLLDSQFAALEEPGADELSITVNIDATIDTITDTIIAELEEISL